MKFRLFTHGDFDGLVSGSIVYRFCLECGLEPSLIDFVNYSSHPLDVWNEFMFPSDEVSIVTDYMFSKALLQTPFFVWSDHHKRKENDFLEVQNGIVLFDENAPSCAHLWRGVARALSPNLADLIPWADMVDSANYESPEQAVLMREPPLQLAVAVSQIFEDFEFKRKLLVQIIDTPVEELIQDPIVKDTYRRYAWKQEKSIDYLTENLVVYSENDVLVGICSFVGYRFSSRYAAFLVNPEIDYLIYIRKIPPWDEPEVSLTVAYNPWKEPIIRLDLNKVIQEVIPKDSGGHERVAAAVLPSVSVATEVARNLAKNICRRENNEK